MKRLLSFILLATLFSACEKENNNENNVKACFSYERSDTLPKEIIQFYNCSEQANTYLWDFGDGETSNEIEPLHDFDDNLPAYVSLTAINGDHSDILIDTIWDWLVAYKPNLYLYPEKTSTLSVEVNFPMGGEIIAAIPEYNDAWVVTVEPSGKINETYDFLFYESRQPNIWQTEKGWCIAQNNLATFFEETLQAYNLSIKEKEDFINYWIAKLNSYAYYFIYPQSNGIIDRVISLSFSEYPDELFRIYFAFEGSTENKTIDSPTIIPAKREKFHAIEWGGLVLN